jgi:hypothetical protein
MNAQIDTTDPWRGLYAVNRLSQRSEYGELIHPDLPTWPDDREEALDKLVRAQGFDFVVVAGDFTDEALENGDELYWEEMRAWNPETPEGDWRLAWMGDTEDGPYAWFVRPMALRPEVVDFQAGVAEWARKCFDASLYCNMTERGDRLLEEVLELLQSKGYDSARVRTLVNYVYGRPVGEPAQEVGGVMVTLAAFCSVAGLDMKDAGAVELARIAQPEVMDKIRRKQALKNALHFDTPLPGSAARQPVGQEPDAYLVQAVKDGEAWEHRWWVPRWGDPDPTALDGTVYEISGKKHPELGTYRVKPFYAEPPAEPADAIERIARLLYLRTCNRRADGTPLHEWEPMDERIKAYFRDEARNYEALRNTALWPAGRKNYAAPPAQAADLGPGVQAIAAERERQLNSEGFSRESDQEYQRGELAKAATAYVQLAAMDLAAGTRDHIAWHGPAAVWPWALKWWKPVDARRDLVRAGALIAAQIDLIDSGKAVGNGN